MTWCISCACSQIVAEVLPEPCCCSQTHSPPCRCCAHAALQVLVHTWRDYLTQPGCSARGNWHRAICTLSERIVSEDVVDSDTIVDLLVTDGKLKGVPGRRLEQADAMELREHIISKLAEEVSLWICWLSPSNTCGLEEFCRWCLCRARTYASAHQQALQKGSPQLHPVLSCCTVLKQHPSLARRCLQAKDATPPRCLLTLKVTTTCHNGHARGQPQDTLLPALSLHHTPQSQPMHLRVRVGGQADLGCCCLRICICQGSGRPRRQAARIMRLKAG